MNNSAKQTGKLPSSDVGIYFKECGSIKDRIAGFEGQHASESMKFLNRSWSGALMLRIGEGDFDALGVLDGEITGEGDGPGMGDRFHHKKYFFSFHGILFLVLGHMAPLLHQLV